MLCLSDIFWAFVLIDCWLVRLFLPWLGITALRFLFRRLTFGEVPECIRWRFLTIENAGNSSRGLFFWGTIGVGLRWAEICLVDRGKFLVGLVRRTSNSSKEESSAQVLKLGGTGIFPSSQMKLVCSGGVDGPTASRPDGLFHDSGCRWICSDIGARCEYTYVSNGKWIL